MFFRETIMEINMDNCFNNLAILEKLNPGKKIKAIIKANAYGHGALNFAKILEENGKVDSFGVATLDEAAQLRVFGIKKPILVLGYVDKADLSYAQKNNIDITCISLNMAKNIHDHYGNLNVHIKVDTGMNRLGVSSLEEFEEVLQLINSSMSKVVGLYTHLSSADDDDEYTNKQISKFSEYCDRVKDENIEIHLQNSDGTIRFKDLDYVNCVRLGLAMYGIDTTKTIDGLKELIHLKTKVIRVKKVGPNEGIGYNKIFITDKDTYIATLPIGYADGFKRCYKDLDVYKYEKHFPIRGKVCMDQMMVEVDEYVEEGDFLYLINEKNSVVHISEKTGILEYEVLTSLSDRIQREYYVDGVKVREENKI